ncbi:hypothetical protein [Abyssalbus ytuae]|uniref:Uncharacterized protein n=1 Tax=Abyssalbus ytuae TaxID=2926907 RepID=A0A9E7CTF5_9FLAO|nr:hypothetical protein [Abyssalbus ytuae]UOB18011.1 hypothetical protein MQE35_01625 [Abyssalbus ytuae]
MKDDKNIEKFTQQLFEEMGLEKPSSSFVSNVMNAVEASSEKSIKYKPLISKKGWIGIGMCFTGFVIWAFQHPLKTSLVPKLDMHFNLNFLNHMNISDTLIYGASILAVMFIIQLIFLKNRLDKQIETL